MINAAQFATLADAKPSTMRVGGRSNVIADQLRDHCRVACVVVIEACVAFTRLVRGPTPLAA